VLHRLASVPPSKFREQVQEWREDLLQQMERRREQFPNVELFPPGKIVQLIHTGNEVTGLFLTKKPKKLYSPRWADTLDFREIRLASHMLDDHSSKNVLAGLEQVAKDFGIS
jgi:hypothetical protein